MTHLNGHGCSSAFAVQEEPNVFEGAEPATVYFWQEIERFTGNVALETDRGESVSYAELAEIADNVGFAGSARRLALIEIDNGLASIAAYLGALRAGHAIILTAADNREYTPELADIYEPELVWTKAGGLVARASTRDCGLHRDLGLMLSTSGSTGSPKLVRLSRENIDANARAIASYLGINGQDRAITTLPLSYSYGLSVLHSHLVAKAAIALTDLSVSDPEFRAFLDQCRPTTIAGVPYTYELMIASGLIDALPKSVRQLTQAGGRLAPELVEQIRKSVEAQGVRFFVMYGATEATARMAFVPPEKLASHPDCIGQPIPGGSFELVNPETGEPAKQQGELVFRGPNVMMGYATSREDLARGAEVDRLLTGDIAEQVAPDMFRITGRKSRFLKIFGVRISLVEAEQLAARLGWQAIATGDDQLMVLAVEGTRNPDFLAEELAEQFKLPSARVKGMRFDTIPRLPSGKPDYPAILAAAHAQNLDAGGDPMAQYAAMLARIARVEAVDDSVTLQGLGGDSLMYVEANMLLEQALDDVPVGWEAIPLGSLRKMAEHAGSQPAAPVEPTREVGFIHSLRSIAILLIIAPHALSALTNVSGGVKYLNFDHANILFVFVAGFLFQYLLQRFSYKEFLKTKALTIALPYAIVSLPAMAIYLFGFKDLAALDAPAFVQGKAMVALYMLLTGTHLGPLWFIPVILLLYLVAPILKRIDETPFAYWLIVPMFLLAFYVGRPPDDNNPLQAFVFSLPAYVLGMAVSHYHRSSIPLLAKIWPLLLVPVVASVFLSNADAVQSSANMLTKVSLSLALVGFLALHATKLPSKFNEIGDLSFGIYLVHGYIAAVLVAIPKLMGWTLQGIPALVGVYAILVLLSLATVLAAKRILNRYSRFIIGA